MFSFFRDRRRRRARGRPPPPALVAAVERNVPAVGALSDDERRALYGHAQVLLDEKHWEGAGGLALTDEMRFTIAAQAALLLLGFAEPEYFPELDTIVVYPDAYVVPLERPNPDGTVTTGAQVRLGESWSRGVVVLSWDDVRRGARDHEDGRNVVLHELAHQLDQEDGVADGAPVLDGPRCYATFSRVMTREYDKLLARVEASKRGVLDAYGATNPAEFFAVASEAFFEKPRALARKHPELYAVLRDFYGQDPAARAAR